MTEPGEDLAARLRALKDRSGLSFGALARQLHVGTSTLHRYCAGDAVPVEFAVVDRFGRLCGASPEELVGLHRAWLMADATRARGAEPPVPAVSGETPPSAPRRRRLLIAVLAAVAVLAGGGIAVAGLLDDDDPVGRQGAPPGMPLTTTVRSHLWEAGCDHNYLVDLPPGQVPEPPVEADALAWSTRVAAVDAGRTIVEVTVAGTEDEPVVLQGLTVRVAERRAPLDWNVYAMSLGCGGALTPATFAVDLDQPRPVARPRAGSDGGEPLPAVTFPFRVSRTEPVVFAGGGEDRVVRLRLVPRPAVHLPRQRGHPAHRRFRRCPVPDQRREEEALRIRRRLGALTERAARRQHGGTWAARSTSSTDQPSAAWVP